MTTPLIVQPEPWMDSALCAQIGGDDWFPEKSQSASRAKRVCNGDEDREPCPVREECLRFALDNDERFGIYGGLSAKERRQLKPRRPVPTPQPIAHGTEAGAKQHTRRGERACDSCRAARNVADQQRRDRAA